MLNAAQWEQLAPTSEKQLSRLSRLRTLCGGDEIEGGTRRISSSKEDNISTGSGKAVLVSGGTAELYQKYYDTDFFEGSAIVSATDPSDQIEAAAEDRVAQLLAFDEQCKTLEEGASRAVELLNTIRAAQEQVTAKTSSLHSTCETLLREEREMKAQVELLKGPLEYFNSLEELGDQLGMPLIGNHTGPITGPKITPGSDAFTNALNRIDECIEYLCAHPNYRDGAVYANKFAQLQSRALALVKMQVVDFLDQATRIASQKPVGDGVLETSAIYSKFKAMSHRIAANVQLIRRHPTAGHMLEECERAFFERRLSLLRPAVRAHLESIHKQRELVGMTRFSSVYLIRISQLETHLYDECMWGDGDAAGGSSKAGDGASCQGLYETLLALCDEMYKYLRPLMLHANDIDALCEIIGVVREEILEEHRGRHGQRQSMMLDSGVTQAAIETVLLKVVHDSQDRLIYLAQRIIQQEIKEFKPTPEQLEYPELLEKAAATGSGAGPYDTWYPPLRTGLLILSKIYRAVDMSVFEDLAQAAVSACTNALMVAARSISQKHITPPGTQPTAGVGTGGGVGIEDPGACLDEHLFLASHLLNLREQLVPFDIQFLHSDRRLNFTTTKTALRRLLMSTPGVFRLNSSNALLLAAKNSIPAVDEIESDIQQSLEQALRSACGLFIVKATDMAAEPLVSYVTKAKVFRSRGEGQGGGDEGLLAQAFSQPDRIKEMLRTVALRMDTALPLITKRLKLYLPNPMTQGVIMNPVLTAIMEGVGEVRSVLAEIGGSVADAAEAEESLQHICEVISQLASTLATTPRWGASARDSFSSTSGSIIGGFRDGDG